MDSCSAGRGAGFGPQTLSLCHYMIQGRQDQPVVLAAPRSVAGVWDIAGEWGDCLGLAALRGKASENGASVASTRPWP